MKPRLFPAMLAVAAAIVAPAIAGATEVLSNGSLRVEIRSDNGAIDTVALAGADYFNPGSPISDWGLQLGTDTASFRLNTTTGSTGFPMTVAVDGATVRASGVYEAGGARVRIVREYSLVASVNALLVASTLRNDGASPVTVRYFDTFDPDQGLVLGYGFDTFNDVYTLGGATAAKAVSVNGHAYVLRSLTAGAVLASGSPFNISGGSVLNSVFSSPYDANGARVDSGQHVVYSVTLAPGASEAISTLHAFGTTLGAAEAAATSVCGNGSVEAEQCDDGDLDDGDGCSHDCRVETGFDCPGAPSACVPVHGDGLVVGGEECDDANLDPGDGCSPAGVEEGGFDCSGTPSFCGGICGDGTVVGEETCDDGDLDGGDGCSSSCAQEAGYTCTGAPSLCLSTCGDGIPVGSEACDDGDLDDGDGCSDNCVEEATFDCSGAPSVCITHCGDGIVDVDEDCDDDARVDGDGCTSTCTLEDGWACTGTPSTCTAVCGDGVLLGDEQCDDGNLEAGDCCSAACDFEPSGESCLAAAIDVPLSSWFAGPFQPLTAGWEFEVRSDSIVTAVGVADCTGAGPVQAHTVAIWDDGADLVFSTTVPAGSSSPSFGGFRYVPVPPLLLEAGHRYVVAALYPQGGGDCVAIGTPGDFDPRLRFLAGREIFTLAGLSYPTAPNTYRFGPNLLLESARGDGLIDIDEECDDGNVDEDDGCNGDGRIEFGYDCAGEPSTCAPTCGDGEVAGDESCDDGDATGGDGCSSACVIEAGFTCVSQPSVCTDSCGDGVIDGGEVCDDGNLVDRDGCSSGCTIDPSFSCSGAPSVCSSECGDGVIDSQEQCDDGNLLDGDCCSSLCLYEPTGPACRTALSGASGGGGGGGVTKMEGWEFTVSAPLTISAVGVYDEPSAAGLAEPHEVGIWDSAQNLLGTATVPAGTEADLLGDFRFVPFPALELTPGEHYTIAALYPAPQNDTVLGTMTFTLDPRVSVVTGRRLPFISSLVFPTDLNVNARIGPTFLMSLTDCGNGSLDADETCDDGDLDPSDGCSEECLAFCPATRRDDCRLAAVSQVSLRDDVTDSKDAFKWKWGKGEATSATEVSDPTDSARYQLCLYPDGDLAGTIQPPPGALWESDGDDGYKYADKAKANGGVQQLRILTRGAGKASVSVKAGGDSLPDSLLPSNSYSVQLIDPNSGICWGSDFPSGKLGDGKFSAKVQP